MAQYAVLIYAADSPHDPGNEGSEKVECDNHAAEIVTQGDDRGVGLDPT